jgi:hypothetical protein
MTLRSCVGCMLLNLHMWLVVYMLTICVVNACSLCTKQLLVVICIYVVVVVVVVLRCRRAQANACMIVDDVLNHLICSDA